MSRIASSISALGTGAPGEVAHLRVSQGGESCTLRIFWDDVAHRWISNPLNFAIESNDGDWVYGSESSGNFNIDWQYAGGLHSKLSRWYLRAGAIPFCGAFYAAGMHLQDRAQMRTFDGGAVCLVSPWFYEFDSSDALSLDNDASSFTGKTWNGTSANSEGFFPSTGNVGHGVVIATPGIASVKLMSAGSYEDGILTGGYHGVSRGTDWDDVKFFTSSTPSGTALGGVPTTSAHTPTKKFLYPTLYCKGFTSNHGFASYDYRVRWVSDVVNPAIPAAAISATSTVTSGLGRRRPFIGGISSVATMMATVSKGSGIFIPPDAKLDRSLTGVYAGETELTAGG